MTNAGAFRFSYFTDIYDETYKFYDETLGFELMHSWDRSAHDKGALFKIGAGLIEILLRPIDDEHRHSGLDYRPPQGAFMVIQVWEIDDLFAKWDSIGVPFEQGLVDRPWGHRTFSVREPNGLVLLFIQEQF